MSRNHDVIAAQAATMAHPDRLQLLSLILTDPVGESSAARLAGPHQPQGEIAAHLEAMAVVGILSLHGDCYRPTHDALVRFGSLSAELRDMQGADRSSNSMRVLNTITDELIDVHDGVLAPETVREFVFESYDLLATRATVQRFLPQLTARFAADRLEALASIRTNAMGQRDDVLFVCVKNAGRSQIAAALMRSLVGDSIRIRTAGSAPATRLDPVVHSELVHMGVAQLTEFPRPLTDEVVRASGVVVTMGCGDACPLVPGRRYVDWQVDDPVGRPATDVRRIIADIGRRVEWLVSELGITPEGELLRRLDA